MLKLPCFKKGSGNYKVYTEESFSEETGIEPKALIDIKALMGDTSDNYPGVKGIGEKTAYKLIKEYSTVDRLLENIGQLTRGPADENNRMSRRSEDVQNSCRN